MSDEPTQLYCCHCNQETAHIRFTAAEIEERERQRNTWQYKILRLLFEVLLGQSDSHRKGTSYYKCSVCDSEYTPKEYLWKRWN